MTLDLPTLYAVAGMASLMAGILHLIPWTTRRFGGWTAWWGGGHVAIGIGSLITLLHDALPMTISVAVPNLLLVAGYAMVLHAVRVFAVPSAGVTGLTILMAVAAVPVILSRDPTAFAHRIAYLCMLRALLDAAIAVTVVRIGRARKLRNAWLMAGMFATTVPLFLVRGWLAMTGHVGATLITGGGTGGDTNSLAAAWLAAASITIIMFRSFSLLLLDAEESHRSLFEQACHDNLTGALNRLGLTRLRGEMSGRAAVMMIDLDRFKQLNDTQGHAAGDAVLRLAAQAGQQVLTGRGTLIRTGGDEFLGVMPGMSLAAAQAAAAELEIRFARLLPATCNLVTLSIGVAEGSVEGGPDEGFERLLHDADAAMYAIKRDRAPSRRRQAA
jgi:diguanylate cyclase (GGDEF)-like protein